MKEESRYITHYYEGGDALEEVAWKSCGHPIPESIPSHIVWGPEQPGLVKVPLAMAEGLELDDL